MDAADLLVLKVFAGGLQDLVDAELLLAGERGDSIRADVEIRLPSLPHRLRRATKGLLNRRRP